jgi:hypothetical protein
VRLVIAKLDWLGRNLAFIAMLMDRKVGLYLLRQPDGHRVHDPYPQRQEARQLSAHRRGEATRDRGAR